MISALYRTETERYEGDIYFSHPAALSSWSWQPSVHNAEVTKLPERIQSSLLLLLLRLPNGPCPTRDVSVGLFSMLAYLYGATDAPDVLEYCIGKVGPDLLLIPGLRLKT